jgi:hypothetical protein
MKPSQFSMSRESSRSRYSGPFYYQSATPVFLKFCPLVAINRYFQDFSIRGRESALCGIIQKDEYVEGNCRSDENSIYILTASSGKN